MIVLTMHQRTGVKNQKKTEFNIVKVHYRLFQENVFLDI